MNEVCSIGGIILKY